MMNLHHWQRMRPRWDITNCFLYEEGPITELYWQSGGEPVHLRLNQRPVWAVWSDVRQIMRTGSFDIIHIFGLRANLLGRLAAHFYAEAKVITGQRNIDSWRKPWHIWADRFTSRWVDLYISNSYAAKKRLQTIEKIPSHKVITIHNGLDIQPFVSATQGLVRPHLDISSDEMVMVCVATLRLQKTHETLLQASKLVKDRGFTFRLLLVGDGPRLELLEDLVGELGLKGQVHFLGSRMDVPAILADSDIKLLSSNWEGLPGAIMEAMAAKLPVVATSVGGVPELVDHGQTGLLVPPENAYAFADAISQLMHDPARRIGMGQAGIQRIADEFLLDDKVAELEAVYMNLVCQPARSMSTVDR